MSSSVDGAVAAVAGLLREQLPSGMVVTEPPAVAAASRVWNAEVTARPLVVARCRSTSDVQAAVRAARAAGVPLSVLGGGHDWAGNAIRDRGLLVDLSPMRQVSVDGAYARVAGGATVSDVLDAVRPHDCAAVVGTVGSVGFAGLTLGGGYGTLIGVAGLGVDNLLSAEVILADGEAAAQIARVRALGRPVLDDVDWRALADTVHALDDVFPRGGRYRLGARILPALTEDAVNAFLQSAEAMPAACALNVHHAHGAAIREPVSETAHAYRDEHLVVEILGAWVAGDGVAETAWVRDTERRLDAYALPGGWSNLMARGDQRAGDAYGINTERLVAVKKHYDPDGTFTAFPLPE